MSLEGYADMRNRPIGIFDSGVGGLTAVKEIMRIMPQENLIYFGDTGRVPYGSKTRNTIIKYALEDINFLNSLNVKMIVAACGTVSSVLTDFSTCVPFTGVLFPTCSAAIKATKNKRICIIGTSATVKSGSYKKQINDIDSSMTVYQISCPLFAPMIESGFISEDNEIVKLVVKYYIEPIKNFQCDTLILGCTHYPIISEAISKEVGKNINIIDSGKETAKYVMQKLDSLGLRRTDSSVGKREFYVSDGTEEFYNTSRIFLGESIDTDIKEININDF